MRRRILRITVVLIAIEIARVKTIVLIIPMIITMVIVMRITIVPASNNNTIRRQNFILINTNTKTDTTTNTNANAKYDY